METVEPAPGYRISRIVKGNWQLAERHGGSYAAADAIPDMRRFVEAGIDAFDCADHYMGVEELIGAFRRRHPELARRIKVHTKIVPDSAILSGIAKSDIAHIVDRARRRLGQERLDLAQFHWWAYDVPGYVESMAWLAEMQREGKIDLIGVTNFDVRRLGEILVAGIKIASNQLQYSAIDRRPDRGMVELCRRHGIALQCYGSVGGGFFS
jgi:aryl-alcohol dehydrogenase-like predicted oxidoreductase